MSTAMNELLSLHQVSVDIRGGAKSVHALRGVDLSLHAGETLALVGESGSGKSVTAMTIAGLLPPNARIVEGDIYFDNVRLNDIDEMRWRALRGARIGMVFQNPMTSFNPSMRVGDQIAEVLIAHRQLSWDEARRQAQQLLDRMRIPQAAARARQYPFEFSGGMLQRAMIAMAVACKPALLIADEPTTALDVTVQAEVLELLRELRRESDMALLLITHDLGIVAQLADRVAVMYAGQIVEQGSVKTILQHAAHPYTRALHAALPAARAVSLQAIPGTPPDLTQPPRGCGFYPRCEYAMKICAEHSVPEFNIDSRHTARCWLQHEQARLKPLVLSDE